MFQLEDGLWSKSTQEVELVWTRIEKVGYIRIKTGIPGQVQRKRTHGIRGLAVQMQFPTTVTSNRNNGFWKTVLQRTGQLEPTGA